MGVSSGEDSALIEARRARMTAYSRKVRRVLEEWERTWGDPEHGTCAAIARRLGIGQRMVELYLAQNGIGRDRRGIGREKPLKWRPPQ
jgi:hypothetical protein